MYPFTAHLVLWWAEVNLNVTNFYTQNSIQGLRILQQYSSVRGDHSGGSLARFSIFKKYSRLLAFCDIVNVLCPHESWGVHIGATCRIRLNDPCTSAMRPYV